MEPSPLLKRILGLLVILLGVPVQQVGRVLDTDAFAEGLDDVAGVVEQVVCVNDTDIDGTVLGGVVSVGSIDAICLVLAGNLGADLTDAAEIIEDPALLVVPCLFRHEVVEASNVIQRRDRAAEVAGNAVLGVSDQEGKVKLLQNICRNDGGVARLGLGIVWVWSTFLAVSVGAIGSSVAVGSIRGEIVRADAALDGMQRRRDRGRLSRRGHQVVGDVFDKDSLSLMDR